MKVTVIEAPLADPLDSLPLREKVTEYARQQVRERNFAYPWVLAEEVALKFDVYVEDPELSHDHTVHLLVPESLYDLVDAVFDEWRGEVEG